MDTQLNCIPYIDENTGKSYKLLAIEPKERTPESQGGLFIPGDVAHTFEEGLVIATCKESNIKKGDVVTYRMFDRTKKENYDTITVEGKTYDVIAENEVWNVNDAPHNRLFIQPLSDGAHVTEGGLVAPRKSERTPERGIVVLSPDNSPFKKGDIVEYRKNTKSIYYSAKIGDIMCDVLYEPDVFMVNEKVSPYKIVVRINLPAQKIKRETAETGLVRSPLFKQMLYNLQYGDVMDIGEHAQQMYPLLNIGDVAILHHGVESDDYRLLKTEYSKRKNPLYEYRIINCFDETHREIFGKFSEKKSSGGKLIDRNKDSHIVPFGKNVFFDWNFEVLDKKTLSSTLVGLDFRVDNCHNIDDLRTTRRHLEATAMEHYKKKSGGLQADRERYDPRKPEERIHFENITAKMNDLKRDAEKMARHVKKDHLLKCTVAYPQSPEPEVITNSSILYPINIMGKKYIIGHSDYIISKYTTNMAESTTHLKPIHDRVLTQVIQEEKESVLAIPDSAKEKPQKALVLSVGPDVKEVKDGDTVYFRRGLGIAVDVDGKSFLALREKDIVVAVTPA